MLTPELVNDQTGRQEINGEIDRENHIEDGMNLFKSESRGVAEPDEGNEVDYFKPSPVNLLPVQMTNLYSLTLSRRSKNGMMNTK